MKRDYYEVLGVARDASESDVKRAFRGLARTLHPDVSDDPEAEDRFREVAEAYEVLSDPERRARYDRYGHEAMAGEQFHTDQFMDLGNLGDLFGALFGRDPFGSAGPAAGPDAQADAEIELADAAFGTDVTLQLELVQHCERCGASGAEPPTQPERCAQCSGSGQVRQVSQSVFGQFVRTGPCPACTGRGVTIESPCHECRGRGRLPGQRSVTVSIPPGIEDAQAIRLTGAGHAGETGAPAGDLYLRVHVRDDPRFRREGRDIVSVVDLTAAEAILGAAKTVPTLDGDAEIEFAAGTQPGEARVLKGKGLPGLRGGGRGVQRVLVNVRIPRELTAEQRELVERLRASEGDHNYHAHEHGGLRGAIRRVFS